jgi:hypothetical protein
MVRVQHDRTSGHTHHICYKRGCTAYELVGCTCACDCSEDGVEFFGEEFGTLHNGTVSQDPTIRNLHEKHAKMGIKAMKAANHNFHEGKFFPNAHRKELLNPLLGGHNPAHYENSVHQHTSHAPTPAPTAFPTDSIHGNGFNAVVRRAGVQAWENVNTWSYGALPSCTLDKRVIVDSDIRITNTQQQLASVKILNVAGAGDTELLISGDSAELVLGC